KYFCKNTKEQFQKYTKPSTKNGGDDKAGGWPHRHHLPLSSSHCRSPSSPLSFLLIATLSFLLSSLPISHTPHRHDLSYLPHRPGHILMLTHRPCPLPLSSSPWRHHPSSLISLPHRRHASQFYSSPMPHIHHPLLCSSCSRVNKNILFSY
ncbi:hypothetical protein HID58_006474, partial [Brassica napus]